MRKAQKTVNPKAPKKVVNKKEVDPMDEVYKYHKTTPKKALPYPNPKTASERWHNAGEELYLVALFLNKGKQCTINDERYIPYFYKDETGVGLAYLGYVYDGDNASAGARLCVFKSDDAIHSGKTFIKQWNVFYTQ